MSIQYEVIGLVTPDILFRHKYVLFDYDGTIVKPKDKRTVSKDADDWQYFNKNVASVLQELDAEEFRLIVITHQTQQWKLQQIISSLRSLSLPCIEVIIVWSKHGTVTPTELCKPNVELYERARDLTKLPRSLPATAVLVGSDDDLNVKFADNLKIHFMTPDIFFRSILYWDTKNVPLQLDDPSIVMICGSPASGKTTLAKMIADETQAFVIHGDNHRGNVTKMLQSAFNYLDKGHSVVLDATFGTREKRDQVRHFALEWHAPVILIFVDISKEDALQVNEMREKPLPPVAIHTFWKHAEFPQSDENPCIVTVRSE